MPNKNRITNKWKHDWKEAPATAHTDSSTRDPVSLLLPDVINRIEWLLVGKAIDGLSNNDKDASFPADESVY